MARAGLGCEGHWFEVLYEDGDDEALSWHDLSRVLACRTQRAMLSWRGWSRSAERKPTEMTEQESNRTQMQRVECLRYGWRVLPSSACERTPPITGGGTQAQHWPRSRAYSRQRAPPGSRRRA